MRPSYMPYPIPDRGRGSYLGRERDMGLQDLHDTTLVLGLGFKPKRDDQPPVTNKTSSFHSSGSVGPALTLGRQSSSSHSTVSSHSDVVKRERSMDGSDGKEEVDEEDGRNKKKLRLTKEQSVLLEDRFKEHSSLNPKQKAALAKQLNLQPRQVEVWFQNRRARTKLKQTEVDCEFLRRCCEMLTEENRRLQNEVKELKSNTTLPPPFYVQPIPTTAVAVGVCPYCQRITGPHDHNNTNSTKVDGKSFTTQPTSC